MHCVAVSGIRVWFCWAVWPRTCHGAVKLLPGAVVLLRMVPFKFTKMVVCRI